MVLLIAAVAIAIVFWIGLQHRARKERSGREGPARTAQEVVATLTSDERLPATPGDQQRGRDGRQNHPATHETDSSHAPATVNGVRQSYNRGGRRFLTTSVIAHGQVFANNVR